MCVCVCVCVCTREAREKYVRCEVCEVSEVWMEGEGDVRSSQKGRRGGREEREDGGREGTGSIVFAHRWSGSKRKPSLKWIVTMSRLPTTMSALPRT